MFGDDDDPTANYHGGDPHSEDAHESIIEHKARLQQMITAYGRSRGPHGTTCDEAEVALNLSHQTCSARFVELKRAGVLVWTPRKRPTRSGRLAGVWVWHAIDPVVDWRNILGLADIATLDSATAVYRALVKRAGEGSPQLAKLNAAIEAARQELGGEHDDD